MKQKMTLDQISKVMHAARLNINGSFKSQRAACHALGIPLRLTGRVSDAHTILTHGIPELIAALEGGQIAFQTCWQIAQRTPPDQQLAILTHVINSEQHGRGSHGLYTGNKGKDKATPQLFRLQHKHHDRICEAVDKLLDAIVERADALGVCTNALRPAPEPDQGRKWRIAIRHCRRALGALEQRIDWTKTEADLEPKPKPIEEGDRHNDADSSNNSDGPQD